MGEKEQKSYCHHFNYVRCPQGPKIIYILYIPYPPWIYSVHFQ